jgi:hypothetical protein
MGDHTKIKAWISRLGAGHEADKFVPENDNVEKPNVRRRSDYRKGTCKRMKDVNLVTWNISSLNRVGAFEKLKDELQKYRFAVAAVQEFRWRGGEIFDSGEFTIRYSGNKEQSLFGTGFVILKNYKYLS